MTHPYSHESDYLKEPWKSYPLTKREQAQWEYTEDWDRFDDDEGEYEDSER